MTTKSGKPAKALNTAEKSSFVDGQVMAELFSKIKEKENIEDNLKIKVDKTPKKILNSNTTDFADQMRYFRNLKGYSQRQVGEKIGVSEDTYRRYELNEIEVTDIKKIKKIIKVLDEPKCYKYNSLNKARVYADKNVYEELKKIYKS